MKFDCGETREERILRLSNWHKRFTFFPTKIANHDCRWLEWIERKGEINSSYDGPYWVWEYRAIK